MPGSGVMTVGMAFAHRLLVGTVTHSLTLFPPSLPPSIPPSLPPSLPSMRQEGNKTKRRTPVSRVSPDTYKGSAPVGGVTPGGGSHLLYEVLLGSSFTKPLRLILTLSLTWKTA